MSSRSDKLEQLHKSLKKHFKVTEDATERNVLECLLYACCLEDTKVELADEAFAKLQQTYFDWNEVRVTTVIELSEVLDRLPNPSAAGARIKRCLQSLYESRYQYDIDDLKKANLSKATEDIQALDGVSPFVLNYVSQHALGGHSIPVDTTILNALVALEILTAVEAEKKTVPGLERAIPKNKGVEFSGLVHQFANELATNSKSAEVAAVFKDFGLTVKVPVSPAKAEAAKKKLAEKKEAEEKELAKKEAERVELEKKAAEKAAADKLAAEKKAAEKKAAEKKAAEKSVPEKKAPARPKDSTPPLSRAKISKLVEEEASAKAVKAADKSSGAKKETTKKASKDEPKDDESKTKSTKTKTASSAKVSKEETKAAPKSTDAKSASAKGSSAKPAPAKGKAGDKPEKTDAKKDADAAKKLANNVKITKKKPK